ncbi:myosin light chain kinase, smooth muscle-like isoform X2 [Scleropages formosus]|uniref:Myosin, light chain kinase 5 n=1 Tax=Scleropages formosus TaxID=113540 RepID=A0A8C9SH39_SCLFO|nr:myosin light chain kinase, smooth muscle-like isoform X2 [Scleropages formosus]
MLAFRTSSQEKQEFNLAGSPVSLRPVPIPRGHRSPVCLPEAPYFLLPPRNAAVHPGDKATFYVKVQGNPEPSVIFFHTGAQVDHYVHPYNLCRLGHGVHILTVVDVSPATAGRYTCEVTNSAGQVQMSFRLELKNQVGESAKHILRRYHSWGESHPRFVTKPCSVTAKEGERVEFKARITGRPPPSVSWLKDSMVLPSTSTIHSFFSSGFHLLQLGKVQRDDQGLYTCRLSSMAGEASASAQLTVTEANPCSILTHSCTSNEMYLQPSVQDQDSSAGGGSLGNGPTPGTVVSRSRTYPVQLATENKPGPAAELNPPRFTEPLKDCTVDEGCDIVLHGVLAGSQPFHISWLHNGEPVHFGTPSLDGVVVRLVVDDCLPEDAGAYTCVAENAAGKTSSSAAVCVRDYETICAIHNKKSVTPPLPNCILESKSWTFAHGPENNSTQQERKEQKTLRSFPVTHKKGITPKRRASSGTGLPVQLKDPPKQVEVRAGETARLQCCFSSSFPVAACWIHNKDQVVDGSRIWVENGDKHSTLVVAEAQASDVGSYIIVVRDRKGWVQHAVSLTVIDRPQPPASCPVISQISGSSLVLSWSGPCYDGGSAIVGYVVETKKEGPGEPGEWKELTGCCRSTSYRVRSGLEPLCEYSFRVRAYNAVGISRPSKESDIIKMDTEGKVQEEPQVYEDFVIDTTNKVTDHYTVLERLGMGKFGQVFQLVHKESGRVCAGKFYKGRRSMEREAARREIQLIKSLHHPKLVQCLGAYDSRSEIVMVMEYVAGGELFERIVDDNFEHTEPTSARYMQQILEGMRYIHQRNIVHLDLKPENVVCVDSSGTNIKIIDFGLASKLDPTTPLKIMQGTPEFVAPEVISFEPVELATDMWSVGVICYILLSGESPFQGNSESETLALVTAAELEFDEDFKEISDQARDFISNLVKKDVRRRLSCDEALAHPWMASFATANPRYTKTLPKEKMKKYLAKQKWKKTGKALLALKRLALLSSKVDGTSRPTSPGEDPGLTPEVEKALKSLEEKLLSQPYFSQPLMDQVVPRGSTVHLICNIQGYPDPEVEWLKEEESLKESSRLRVEYEEDGSCMLLLADAESGDSGLYTCRAANSQGEAHCSARLSVEG